MASLPDASTARMPGAFERGSIAQSFDSQRFQLAYAGSLWTIDGGVRCYQMKKDARAAV